MERKPKKIYEIKYLGWTKAYIDKAKRVSFPGFDKVPVFDVALFFIRGIRDGAIITRAESVAFNFILALFPTVLVFFTLIPLIPIDNFQTQILSLIQSIVPETTYSVIQRTIEDIIIIKRGGLFSIGFVVALIFSTNGIVSLIQSFNASIHVEDTRSWLKQRTISLMLVVILSLLVTLGIMLITFTQTLMLLLVHKGVMQQNWTYYLVTGGKWVVILALFYFAYSFVFYFGPAKKSKYRFISVGATLATALTILVTVGFGFFIDHFGRYNALYGSIGTLPVIMLMIFLNSLSMILGFELNIGIVAARKVNGTKSVEKKGGPGKGE
ncbi:MAG: YihY/virulence factor BrkB family protein [Candidatus Marinimicrobia bacterium]|nr:YihY/virulence factor BrkB family protein [Candidatus Neomarinimicrobiota bacterium]